MEGAGYVRDGSGEYMFGLEGDASNDFFGLNDHPYLGSSVPPLLGDTSIPRDEFGSMPLRIKASNKRDRTAAFQQDAGLPQQGPRNAAEWEVEVICTTPKKQWKFGVKKCSSKTTFKDLLFQTTQLIAFVSVNLQTWDIQETKYTEKDVIANILPATFTGTPKIEFILAAGTKLCTRLGCTFLMVKKASRRTCDECHFNGFSAPFNILRVTSDTNTHLPRILKNDVWLFEGTGLRYVLFQDAKAAAEATTRSLSYAEPQAILSDVDETLRYKVKMKSHFWKIFISSETSSRVAVHKKITFAQCKSSSGKAAASHARGTLAGKVMERKIEVIREKSPESERNEVSPGRESQEREDSDGSTSESSLQKTAPPIKNNSLSMHNTLYPTTLSMHQADVVAMTARTGDVGVPATLRMVNPATLASPIDPSPVPEACREDDNSGQFGSHTDQYVSTSPPSSSDRYVDTPVILVFQNMQSVLGLPRSGGSGGYPGGGGGSGGSGGGGGGGGGDGNNSESNSDDGGSEGGGYRRKYRKVGGGNSVGGGNDGAWSSYLRSQTDLTVRDQKADADISVTYSSPRVAAGSQEGEQRVPKEVSIGTGLGVQMTQIVMHTSASPGEGFDDSSRFESEDTVHKETQASGLPPTKGEGTGNREAVLQAMIDSYSEKTKETKKTQAWILPRGRALRSSFGLMAVMGLISVSLLAINGLGIGQGGVLSFFKEGTSTELRNMIVKKQVKQLEDLQGQLIETSSVFRTYVDLRQSGYGRRVLDYHGDFDLHLREQSGRQEFGEICNNLTEFTHVFASSLILAAELQAKVAAKVAAASMERLNPPRGPYGPGFAGAGAGETMPVVLPGSMPREGVQGMPEKPSKFAKGRRGGGRRGLLFERRSFWGTHIPKLPKLPERGGPPLDEVCARMDGSKIAGAYLRFYICSKFEVVDFDLYFQQMPWLNTSTTSQGRRALEGFCADTRFTISQLECKDASIALIPPSSGGYPRFFYLNLTSSEAYDDAKSLLEERTAILPITRKVSQQIDDFDFNVQLGSRTYHMNAALTGIAQIGAPGIFFLIFLLVASRKSRRKKTSQSSNESSAGLIRSKQPKAAGSMA